MKKLDENTVVEVGKFYLVRCAILSDGKKEFIIPVIGEVHNDNQFGFPHKHIHADGRFCGKNEMIHTHMNDQGRTNFVLTFPGSPNAFSVQGFTEKVKKCHRLTTGITPPKKRNYFNAEAKGLFDKWVDGMIGKNCKGKKCPHLGTTMFEENGVLVCPLHNLISDENKEKIVGVKY